MEFLILSISSFKESSSLKASSSETVAVFLILSTTFATIGSTKSRASCKLLWNASVVIPLCTWWNNTPNFFGTIKPLVHTFFQIKKFTVKLLLPTSLESMEKPG